MKTRRVEKRYGLVVALLAFVVAGSATAFMLEQAESSRRTTRSEPGPRPLVALFDPKQPLFPNGERTTIEEAAGKAGYEILRPMKAGEPSEVWIGEPGEPGEGIFEVGLRYGGDLVVLLAPWPKGKDAADTYARQTREFGTGYTTTIAGAPARVRPYDPDKDEYPVDAIHVVVGGVEVSIYGTSGDPATSIVDDLLALAEDLGA